MATGASPTKINRIDELLPWNTEPAANLEADA